MSCGYQGMVIVQTVILHVPLNKQGFSRSLLMRLRALSFRKCRGIISGTVVLTARLRRVIKAIMLTVCDPQR